MSKSSHIPTKSQKNLGYLLVAAREFLNGFDNGGGYVKLPIWALGLSVTAFFAPYVLIGGGIFAVIYLIRALADEYENNKKEQEKIAQKRNQIASLLAIEEELKATIEANLEYEEDIHAYLLSARIAKKNEQEIELELKKLVQNKLKQKYPFFSQPADDDKETNKPLLMALLRDYFAALGDIEVHSGSKLPSQNKILKLVQKVTGFNPYHTTFHNEMQAYLASDPSLQASFAKVFPNGEIESTNTGLWSKFKKTLNNTASFIKNMKKLRHLGKKLIDFLSDWGTGSGITAALMTMFGIVVAGSVVAWPLIVAIVGSGLLFGIISLSYQLISGDRNKRNVRKLDAEVDQNQTKLELSKRLLKIQKDPKKIALKKFKLEKEAIAQVHEERNHVEPNEEMPLIEKTKGKKISAWTYARMGLGIASQTLLAISLGMIISLGIVWVGTLLWPALPLLVPTLGFGGVLSLFYIYRSLKAEIKSIKSELNKIEQVSEHKHFLISKYKNNEQVTIDLKKQNPELLKEVLEEYVSLLQNLGGKNAKHSNGKYPKQEKIFSLIESVAGVKRNLDAAGKLQLCGDDSFYNALAHYIKGSSKDSSEANALVQKFKNLHYDPLVSPSITNENVNADDPKVNKKEGFFKKAGSFIKDNFFPFIGFAAIGLMLPLFLMGPQIAIVAGIAAVIVTAFVVAKVVSTISQRSTNKLNQKELRYNLIDRKHKIAKQNKEVHQKNEVALTSEVSFERSLEKTLSKSKHIKAIKQEIAVSKPQPEKEYEVSSTVSQMWLPPARCGEVAAPNMDSNLPPIPVSA